MNQKELVLGFSNNIFLWKLHSAFWRKWKNASRKISIFSHFWIGWHASKVYVHVCMFKRVCCVFCVVCFVCCLCCVCCFCVVCVVCVLCELCVVCVLCILCVCTSQVCTSVHYICRCTWHASFRYFCHLQVTLEWFFFCFKNILCQSYFISCQFVAFCFNSCQ